MKNLCRLNRCLREEGQTVVEYLLLIAVISLLMLSSLSELHQKLGEWLPKANEQIARSLQSGHGFQR